ncbi:MAG: quinone-dependent dihydroorotate dehydrogenase, partial [Sphingobacteriales bacterium]
MYKLIRAIFFLFDPERVHYFSMNLLEGACRFPVIGKLITKLHRPAHKPVEFAGLSFRNAVGLGAGFDKNASYLPSLNALGFGFVEIGTVTPLPQDGNEKPRLFRLVKDMAIINRMGFNNKGVDHVLENLKAWRKNTGKASMLIGGNIGKNKMTPNAEAWKDYEICFKKLYDVVDYFVVNVSSPNTPGLRELQEKPALKKILTTLQDIRSTFSKKKPLLLKIAPDLERAQVDDIISLASEISLDGLIISNTTIESKGLKTSEVELK